MATAYATAEVRVQDDNGLVNPITLYVSIDDTTTLATLQTWFTALVGMIDDVIDGKMTLCRMSVDYAATGSKADPVAECNNQEQGLLSFEVSGSKYRISYALPSFKDTLAVQGLIENTGDVATLTAWMAAGAHNGVTITDRAHNALSAFQQGRSVFRKLRRQLARAASAGHHA